MTVILLLPPLLTTPAKIFINYTLLFLCGWLIEQVTNRNNPLKTLCLIYLSVSSKKKKKRYIDIYVVSKLGFQVISCIF